MLHAGIILVAVLCSIMAYNIFSVTREGLKAKKNKATKATKATKPTKPTKAKALTKKQLAAAAKAAAAKAAATQAAGVILTVADNQIEKDKKTADEKLAKVMETDAIAAGYATPALFAQAATAANYSTPALFSADIHDAGFTLGSDFTTALKKSGYSTYAEMKSDLNTFNARNSSKYSTNFLLTELSTNAGTVYEQLKEVIQGF